MNLLVASVLGLVAGTGLAACPYAEKASAPRDCPYASKLDARTDTNSSTDWFAPPAEDKIGVMFMNRIAPSGSQLWIANADGSNATKLMGNQSAPMDYHPKWSADGEWITFTSERRSDGQSDLYRVKPDGTGLETLVQSDSFEDIGSISPDGSKLAYVSTAINYTANIFIQDFSTNKTWNVTGSDETIGDFISPHSFYRPAWSPDGEWLAFSSDINTDWTGHSDGQGWEHTQTLSLYVVRSNGSDFRKVIGEDGFSLGTPNWSPDGSRLAYYNMTREATYDAHSSGLANSVESQIFSTDVATGLKIIQHTSGENVKVAPHYIGNSSNIGYLLKDGSTTGINYTIPDATHTYVNTSTVRDPEWSRDGSKVVYQVYDWTVREAGKPLFSWDSQREYRFMDVFPQLNNVTGKLLTTQKQLGNASTSVVVTDPDNYNDLETWLDVYDVNTTSAMEEQYEEGGGGAFQPTWGGDKIAVGFGVWFFERGNYNGVIYLSHENGSYYNLTDGSNNAGFPSFNPEGTKVVYRVWDWDNGPTGLKILDLESGETTNLTDGWDNTPGWSPDGSSIVFTRNTNWTWGDGEAWSSDRFDICTINPDGTNFKQLTFSNSNDAHAVWSDDGRILYNSGMYGFRDESALYDDTFQPYGQIVIMNADGSNKTMLTDSMWEDSMPLYVGRGYFE